MSEKKSVPPVERILEAADTLFCELGFDGVSMRDVAQRARVNKASVFYYYNSKAALFSQVLDRYYDAHTRALQAAYDPDLPTAARFHRMIDAYLDFMVDNRRYALLVQQQVADEETRELIKAKLSPMFGWIIERIAEVAPREGHLSAHQFFVTFSGMVVNYFTYAPVLADLFGDDPLSPASIAQRRDHIHWMVEMILERLGLAE